MCFDVPNFLDWVKLRGVEVEGWVGLGVLYVLQFDTFPTVPALRKDHIP